MQENKMFKFKYGSLGFGSIPNIGLYNDYLKTWEEINQYFSQFTLQLAYGKALIEFNWSKVLELQKRYVELEILFWHSSNEDKIKMIKDSKFDLGQDSVCVDCSILLQLEGEDSNVNSMDILGRYIYSLYLVSNIAMPGSFSLFNAKLISEDNIKVFEGYSDSFTESWYFLDKYKWPNIERLGIEQTWKWYMKTGFFGVSVANTNVIRTLTALYNAVTCDSYDQTSVIWITLGLEAILNLPSNSINKLLKERMFILLGEPNEKKKITRVINNLYNYRSRFVHGDYDLLLKDLMTKDIEKNSQDKFVELYTTINNGISLLVALFQTMVKLDRNQLNFVEVLLTNDV